MLHLDWESRANRQSLPVLLERRRLTGGKIVVFQRVVSFVFFTRLSNHYCLVSPYESRSLRGFIFFLPTFVTGWWSPSGVLHTCYALAHDLLGGVDVTAQIDDPHSPRDAKKDRSFIRKRFLLSLVLIICILLPLFAWISLVLIK